MPLSRLRLKLPAFILLRSSYTIQPTFYYSRCTRVPLSACLPVCYSNALTTNERERVWPLSLSLFVHISSISCVFSAQRQMTNKKDHANDICLFFFTIFYDRSLHTAQQQQQPGPLGQCQCQERDKRRWSVFFFFYFFFSRVCCSSYTVV